MPFGRVASDSVVSKSRSTASRPPSPPRRRIPPCLPTKNRAPRITTDLEEFGEVTGGPTASGCPACRRTSAARSAGPHQGRPPGRQAISRPPGHQRHHNTFVHTPASTTFQTNSSRRLTAQPRPSGPGGPHGARAPAPGSQSQAGTFAGPLASQSPSPSRRRRRRWVRPIPPRARAPPAVRRPRAGTARASTIVAVALGGHDHGSALIGHRHPRGHRSQKPRGLPAAAHRHPRSPPHRPSQETMRGPRAGLARPARAPGRAAHEIAVARVFGGNHAELEAGTNVFYNLDRGIRR